MDKISTKAAELIYEVLVKYAEASSRYYDREGFIYCVSLVPNTPRKFTLRTMDGKRRVFTMEKGVHKMIGKGDVKVNSIIKHIIKNNPRVEVPSPEVEAA